VCLWRATSDLVDDSKQNAERQLRAYIGPGDVFIDVSTKEIIYMTISNFGLTPAFKVVATTDHWLSDASEKVTKPHIFGMFDPRKDNVIAIVLPEDTNLQDRARTFFVDTTITYKDAFDVCYERKFLYHLNLDLAFVKDPRKMMMYPASGQSDERIMTGDEAVRRCGKN